jgi:hypothetical protein
VSYNGGPGGIDRQPTAEERIAENDHHTAMTSEQTAHEHSASTNRAFLASENHGRPAVAATARPGEFTGKDVVASRGNQGGFHPPANNTEHASNTSHPANNGGNSHAAGNAPRNEATQHPNGGNHTEKHNPPPQHEDHHDDQHH